MSTDSTKTAQQLVAEAVAKVCDESKSQCEEAGLYFMARQWDKLKASLTAKADQVYDSLSTKPEYVLAMQGYPHALAEAAAIVQLMALVKTYLPLLLSLAGAGIVI